MKRNTIALLAILTLMTFSGFAQAPDAVKPAKQPTVKEILEKYISALGGREAIEKIKSRSVTGTVELAPMGLKGTFEASAAPETRSFTRLTIAGVGDLLEGIDGKTAWAVNPIQGSRDKTGAELSQAKIINDFYREVRLDKLFPKMELKGTEKVDGRNAYVIVATADGLPAETWYFDAESGLMLRSDMTASAPEGSQPMTAFYDDYRNVDGIKMPFKIRTRTPSFEIILVSTEVKHNVPIEDSKFVRPKS